MKKVFCFLVALLSVGGITTPSRARATPQDKVKAYTYTIEAQLLRMERANPKQLIPLYGKIIRILPNPSSYIDYAHALLEDGNLREALNILEEGYQLFPQNPRLPILLGEIYLNLGKTKQALFYLKEALKRDPKNPDLYEKLVEIYMKSKNYDAAFNPFQEWKKHTPPSLPLPLGFSHIRDSPSDAVTFAQA